MASHEMYCKIKNARLSGHV